MKKFKKNIIISFFLVGIVTGLFLGINFMQQKGSNSNNEVIKEENEILDQNIQKIINEEVEGYNTEELENIKNQTEEILGTSNYEEVIGKSYFILGYIDYINLEYESAAEKYDNALINLGEKDHQLLVAEIHFNLSEVYVALENYDKSKEEYNKTIEICEKESFKDKIVSFNVKRSSKMQRIPNGIEDSIGLMEETVKLAESINYEYMERVYFEMGIKYWYVDRLIEATNYKLQALALAQSKDMQILVCTISTDLGVDYLAQENYEEAIKYFEMSLNYNLEDPYQDADSKSYSLLNLCSAYMEIGQFEEAKEHFIRLEEEIDKCENGFVKEDTRTYMYLYKASLETALNNPIEALRLIDLADSRYKLRDGFSYYNFDIETAIEYGNAYYKLEEYEKALEYHKEAEKLIEETQASYLEISINEYLYLDYKSLNDLENTIKYLEKNNNLRAEAKNYQDMQYSQYLIKKFDDDKNKETITKLEDSQDRMKNSIISLVFITLIIILLSSFIFNKNKEIQRLNKLFKNLSITDGLTKIPNRRALDEYLNENWEKFIEEKRDLAIIMMDIDYFKRYNDNYGHLEGDKVLETVASCINDTCADSGFIARYGGEEFIVIIEDSNKEKCLEIVESIRKSIDKLNIKHEYSKISNRITLSIGIAAKNHSVKETYIESIKRADEALYKAKENGRNRYEYIE